MTFCTCYIRKKQVVETPEEMVRQRLLLCLCLQKGFPVGLCSVEVSLERQNLPPNLQSVYSHNVSRRRVDILFSRLDNSKNNYEPFFVIECKAQKIGKKSVVNPYELPSFRQLSGYRYILGKVPFLGVAFEDEILIWYQEGLRSHDLIYRGPVESCFSWEEFTKIQN